MLKTCTRCNVEKSVEEFYVKVKATGRRLSWCKECHNKRCLDNYFANHEAKKESAREYAAAHREERNAYNQQYRQENAEKVAAYAREYNEKNKEDRAAYRKAYKAINAESIRQKSAEYREANKDAIDASNADYRRKNAEILRQRQRAWREANPERYAEIHRRWKAFNSEAVAAATARRRAREYEAEGNYTAKEWKALKEATGHTCLCCGRQEPHIKLTPDHVKALSRGGSNWISNIQPLCGSCNSKKHAKEIDYRPPVACDDWLGDREESPSPEVQ